VRNLSLTKTHLISLLAQTAQASHLQIEQCVEQIDDVVIGTAATIFSESCRKPATISADTPGLVGVGCKWNAICSACRGSGYRYCHSHCGKRGRGGLENLDCFGRLSTNG
jgi:hypothetical protein